MLLHERVLYSHLFDAVVAIYKLSLATSNKHDVLITHDCSKKDNTCLPLSTCCMGIFFDSIILHEKART